MNGFQKLFLCNTDEQSMGIISNKTTFRHYFIREWILARWDLAKSVVGEEGCVASTGIWKNTWLRSWAESTVSPAEPGEGRAGRVRAWHHRGLCLKTDLQHVLGLLCHFSHPWNEINNTIHSLVFWNEMFWSAFFLQVKLAQAKDKHLVCQLTPQTCIPSAKGRQISVLVENSLYLQSSFSPGAAFPFHGFG